MTSEKGSVVNKQFEAHQSEKGSVVNMQSGAHQDQTEVAVEVEGKHEAEKGSRAKASTTISGQQMINDDGIPMPDDTSTMAVLAALVGLSIMLVVVIAAMTVFPPKGETVDYSREKDPNYWRELAHSELEVAMKDKRRGVAKNIVMFVGDGMDIATVTAARIMKGQMQGRKGEEVKLNFEHFPYTGFAKTYNTDYQVTDSSAATTALFSGVKTNQETLGINGHGIKSNCSSVKGNELTNILDWSLQAGKSVGMVTTTRVTHATPSALYAHSPNRFWESDSKVPESEKACKDMAAQLIERSDMNVVLGGGRASFYPEDYVDPHADKDAKTRAYRRKDGRNLLQEWESKMKKQNKKYKYVYDRDGLEAVNPRDTDYLLGIFSQSHMAYDRLRNKAKEPSLAEMTAKAIEILKKNENGFFLMIEGGLIDYGHHITMPSLALHDTIALDDAVKTAMEKTNVADTLTIVTADHGHVFGIAGYSVRGNNILGLARGENKVALKGLDKLPYATLGYTNGRHAPSPREDLTDVDTTDPMYQSQVAVPLFVESHDGKDVATYAIGPQSFLFNGVHEQNYAAIVMAYASCVGAFAEGGPKKCAKYEPVTATRPTTPACKA